MRILIIGQKRLYEDMVKATPTGRTGQIEFADYCEAADITQPASVVFVEANLNDQRGLIAARIILQRFPGTTTVLLMQECQFEYSMQAMRMGAQNILVGNEINVASMEQVLQQHTKRDKADQREGVARNFERMIFLYNEGAEWLWNAQALNEAFEMQKSQKRFFVLLATSMDFVHDYHHSETVMKKVYSEKVKNRLMQICDSQVSIPFVFYIDQLFYIAAVCDRNTMPESPQLQIQFLQNRIYNLRRVALESL